METAGQTDSVDGEVVSRTGKEISSMNVPLVRNQLRSAEMLDAVRIHRQGGLTVALEEKRNVSVGDLCKFPWLVTQYCSQRCVTINKILSTRKASVNRYSRRIIDSVKNIVFPSCLQYLLSQLVCLLPVQ